MPSSWSRTSRRRSLRSTRRTPPTSSSALTLTSPSSTQLDTEIAAQTKDLPRKDFVSFHSAFQYYARAYGLQQVAVLEEFPGKEPSPQYLAGIVDLIKKLGVTAVFAEPQFSSRPAEALAKEVGVQVRTVDPEGAALTPAGYEQLMRANTAAFVQALGGTS